MTAAEQFAPVHDLRRPTRDISLSSITGWQPLDLFSPCLRLIGARVLYIIVIYMKAWMECTGFEWDDGNSGKNWEKHGVADFEAEEIFFNRPFIVRHDAAHASDEENRWRAFGRTDKGRYLFVAFTVRRTLIRVISARVMTRRERRFYES